MARFCYWALISDNFVFTLLKNERRKMLLGHFNPSSLEALDFITELRIEEAKWQYAKYTHAKIHLKVSTLYSGAASAPRKD